MELRACSGGTVSTVLLRAAPRSAGAPAIRFWPKRLEEVLTFYGASHRRRWRETVKSRSSRSRIEW
jgi:hypothetical protein